VRAHRSRGVPATPPRMRGLPKLSAAVKHRRQVALGRAVLALHAREKRGVDPPTIIEVKPKVRSATRWAWTSMMWRFDRLSSDVASDHAV